MALPVVLIPLPTEGRSALTSALIIDYVDYLVSQGEEKDPFAAHKRAQVEIEAELRTAFQVGDGLWAAHNIEKETVGWLWIKYAQEGLPHSAVFLYQILIKEEFRRQGYGTAMLTALEEALAEAGWSELYLNVWGTNQAAIRLYERAGYELVEQFPVKRQLRKQLRPAG